MSLDDLYQQIILEHYRAPKNRAPSLEGEDVHVHHSNPLCGDELDLRVDVEDDLGDGIVFQGVAKFPVRVKCALLGWMALKDALETYRSGEHAHSVTIDGEV